MTKYILHGGASNNNSENNKNFFLEIINSVNSSRLNILCIYFARPEHRWEDSFAEDKDSFNSLETNKDLVFQMAKLDSREFSQQILQSDIIFINGGRNGCLKDVLEGLDNLTKLIDGKVIVGISAGANILAKYYYSSVADDIREGIGLLPIKTFCHFTKKNISELDELDKYKEKLPIYKIPEEKYLVLDID
jgi:peptidase E